MLHLLTELAIRRASFCQYSFLQYLKTFADLLPPVNKAIEVYQPRYRENIAHSQRDKQSL